MIVIHLLEKACNTRRSVHEFNHELDDIRLVLVLFRRNAPVLIDVDGCEARCDRLVGEVWMRLPH